MINTQALKKIFLNIFKYICSIKYIIAIIIIIVALYFLRNYKKNSDIIDLITDLLVGLIFLFITSHLDKKLENEVKKIKKLTIKSENVLSRREKELETEKSWQQFIHFVETDTHYNIRIPEVKTLTHPIGLEYTVIPIRDDKTNKPILYENSMEKLHIIKILEPANWEYLLSDKKYAKHIIDYQNSPIKVGEYYFCKFINNKWNLSFDNMKFYEFYFSSKMGEVHRIISASEYMGKYINETLNKKEISSFYLDIETENTGKGFSHFKIFLDTNSNRVYLKIDGSCLKQLYYRTLQSSDDKYELVIENIMGYTHGEKLEILKHKIENELKLHQINLPKLLDYT